jgi:Na+/H+ antiporter NhaD/arsenite permease-like protein
MRVARSEGANVSAGRYSKIGLILVPVSMVAALVSVQLFVPGA